MTDTNTSSHHSTEQYFGSGVRSLDCSQSTAHGQLKEDGGKSCELNDNGLEHRECVSKVAVEYSHSLEGTECWGHLPLPSESGPVLNSGSQVAPPCKQPLVQPSADENTSQEGRRGNILPPASSKDEVVKHGFSSLPIDQNCHNTPEIIPKDGDSPYAPLSLSSSLDLQESTTVAIGSYQNDASCSLTMSQQRAIGMHESGSSSMTTSVGAQASHEHSRSKQWGEDGVRAYGAIATDPDANRRCISPFLMVEKSDVKDTSKFESPGLLYARATSGRLM